MQITEIFRSIQGESTYAGMPCIFVRLTGCNLRCVWCDTAYAFYGGRKMSVEEVLAEAEALSGSENPSIGGSGNGLSGGEKGTAESGAAATNGNSVKTMGGSSGSHRRVNLIELTGGEPLLQDDIYPLVDRLLERQYKVLIETSGERFIGTLPPPVVKIVDVKCPGSGMGETFCEENLAALQPHDQLKFVIADRRDYEWAREFLRGHPLEARVEAITFSPVFDQLEPRALAEWILEDGLPVRLGLQLHKFIWDPAARGV